MTTINQLTEADTLANGDQLPIFSEAQGDTRKVNFLTLKESVADEFVSLADLAAQTGAGLVGTADGTDVQQALDARITTTALALSTASAGIGFIQSGTGATARTVQAKLRDIGSAFDFGAVGNGVANDSAAFTSAITAKSNVLAASGQNSVIKDVALSNSQSLVGFGSILKAATGATNLVTLADFSPRFEGYYLSDTTACSAASIRVKAARYACITNIVSVNGGVGFLHFEPVTPASTVVAVTTVSNCHAEDISGTGVLIGSSVSEIIGSNIHIYGKLTAGTGGQRPIFTTTGWRQNTPVVGGLAVGGHQIANANMINFNRGFYLTDAQLSFFSNCIADSCSDYGVLVDGASQKIKFADLFVGTTRGIKVAGTSEVWIDGLQTHFNGVIPPWGSTDFYNGVGTFYDVEVRNTATLRISNWKGDKRIIVDSGAKLLIEGGTRYNVRSIGTVGAGTTAYMAEWGSTTNESDTLWRAPCDGHLVGIQMATSAAPGAGQSYTYTARKNGADTALTGSATGAGVFSTQAWSATNITVSRGDQISLKIVTSAGAAASYHNGQLLFLPS